MFNRYFGLRFLQSQLRRESCRAASQSEHPTTPKSVEARYATLRVGPCCTEGDILYCHPPRILEDELLPPGRRSRSCGAHFRCTAVQLPGGHGPHGEDPSPRLADWAGAEPSPTAHVGGTRTRHCGRGKCGAWGVRRDMWHGDCPNHARVAVRIMDRSAAGPASHGAGLIGHRLGPRRSINE